MMPNWILERESDKKKFIVVFLSHWSDIVAVDDPNNKDSVKWYGGVDGREQFVSANGECYVHAGERELSRKERISILVGPDLVHEYDLHEEVGPN